MAMSSSEQPQNQIYLHSNDSSLSTIQFQNFPTQVSSVGFNTLKKQITSSSLNLSVATSNTIKPNPISKLFSRNRSSLTIHEDLSLMQSFDDKSRLSIDDDQNSMSQKGSGLFRISRKLRSKLKFSNKGVTRPDLTIQTTGHHSLKVPKKILSSATSDEFGSKKALSSPISRGLFHRQHNQIDSAQSGNEEAKPRHPKHHRTAMDLSSQSSNSFISDINVAVLYNFTDPDYSVSEFEENSESLMFLDFHKIYMTSADQYIASSKSHRTENGVNEEILSNDVSLKKSIDGQESGIEELFGSLFDLLKPLFQPSKQTILTNGLSNPNMTLTMEQAKRFVEERIICSARSLLTSKYTLRHKGVLISDEKSEKGSSENLSMTENLEEDIQDLRRKELGQHLSFYFEKYCLLLADDTRNFDSWDSMARSMSSMRSESQHAPRLEDRISTEHSYEYEYLQEWRRIELIWQYFNSKVRFFILNAFQQLQKHFDDEERVQVNNGQKSWNVQIENALLLAFRDTVVIPHLLRRQTDPGNGSLSVHEPIAAEIHFFRNKGTPLATSLRKCFGAILSHLQSELAGSDDQPFKEMMFDEYVQWFTEITR